MTGSPTNAIFSAEENDMSKYRLKFKQTSGHDTLKTLVPAIILALVGLVVAYQFVGPPPPKSLVLSAGADGGAYATYAERYHERLAENGIELEIRTSAGSMEKLERLQAAQADAAFVQTGVIAPGETGDASERTPRN